MRTAIAMMASGRAFVNKNQAFIAPSWKLKWCDALSTCKTAGPVEDSLPQLYGSVVVWRP
jgi:hypothetical protein